MRSHPVVGTFFLITGLGLFAAGALGNWSPAPLAGLPLPASVIIPFALWQLALWCALFGAFFLRARGRAPGPKKKARWAL